MYVPVKPLALCNTPAYWAHSKVTKKRSVVNMATGLYLQHSIFFVTNDWAQITGVFVLVKPL
jgi:hypothetical protein